MSEGCFAATIRRCASSFWLKDVTTRPSTRPCKTTCRNDAQEIPAAGLAHRYRYNN